MTLLLVDDDENCRTLWARMLSKLDAELRFAGSVAEAIAQMAKVPPPDLILLDLKLPPHGAEATLSAIGTLREFNPNLSVVAISGMRLDEILKVIEASGIIVEGALSKDESFTQGRLLKAVETALVRKGKANYQQTMQMLEQVSDVIEKKRTDRINLPPSEV